MEVVASVASSQWHQGTDPEQAQTLFTHAKGRWKRGFSQTWVPPGSIKLVFNFLFDIGIKKVSDLGSLINILKELQRGYVLSIRLFLIPVSDSGTAAQVKEIELQGRSTQTAPSKIQRKGWRQVWCGREECILGELYWGSNKFVGRPFPDPNYSP